MRKILLSILLILPMAAQSPQTSAENKDLDIQIVLAAGKGDYSILKSLLSDGGNASATTSKGISALQYAVQFNQIQTAELLLDSGAIGINDLQDYNLQGGVKVRLLSFSVWNKFSGMASMLLKHGADPKLFDSDGNGPLSGAIVTEIVDTVKLLLDAGIDPNIRWEDGDSAVAKAALRGHVDILKCLLDHKGKPDSRDDFGMTPLMYAAQMGRESAVQLLLDRGAPVYPLNAWGRSALGQTKYVKEPEIANRISDILRKAGAKINDPVRPIDYEFLKAVYKGDIAKVKSLLIQGADINARGKFDGQILLSDALSLSVNHPNICHFLLDKNINPLMMWSSRLTALHIAARDGGPEVIEMLIAKGLNPNSRSKDGFVPLFMAINGNSKLANVSMLLKLGADPNAQSVNPGENLIQFAKSRNEIKVVELLLAAGAK